ncbi:MAG: hypothetical protein M3Q99_07110 [Acidobacteriota bacterium]|nr:hypothetical protein [Acidobacteriota bacterium]
MADPYEDGQWRHPGELVPGGRERNLRNAGEGEDASESFITRLPKAVNSAVNRKLDKIGLKDKVEIGKLQVEHITNANHYADQYFDLENKSKTNKAKGLELDKKILENENALKDVQTIDSHRDLQNKDKKLDLDISIAEKEARLNVIRNPPAPQHKPDKREQRAAALKEIEESIGRVTRQIEKIEKYSVLSEDDKQRQLNQLRNKLFDLEERQNDLL